MSSESFVVTVLGDSSKSDAVEKIISNISGIPGVLSVEPLPDAINPYAISDEIVNTYKSCSGSPKVETRHTMSVWRPDKDRVEHMVSIFIIAEHENIMRQNEIEYVGND